MNGVNFNGTQSNNTANRIQSGSRKVNMAQVTSGTYLKTDGSQGS